MSVHLLRFSRRLQCRFSGSGVFDFMVLVSGVGLRDSQPRFGLGLGWCWGRRFKISSLRCGSSISCLGVEGCS